MNTPKYFIVVNGLKKGPFTAIELVNQEKLSLSTLVWYEGLNDWVELRNIKELTVLLESGKEKKKNKWFTLIVGSIVVLVLIYRHSDLFDAFYSGEIGSQGISSAGADEFLQIVVDAVDYANPITNDFALRLASRYPGEYNLNQICKIYDHLVTEWKYVNDSDKKENIRSASRTISNNLAGDCDDFAILMAATIESIGGDARISFAYNQEGGHAFAEVYVANSENEMERVAGIITSHYRYRSKRIHYRRDEDGKYWLNLDWFGSPQHPGGEYFDFEHEILFYPTSRPPFYKENNRNSTIKGH